MKLAVLPNSTPSKLCHSQVFDRRSDILLQRLEGQHHVIRRLKYLHPSSSAQGAEKVFYLGVLLRCFWHLHMLVGRIFLKRTSLECTFLE